jgi:hypothetical protein
MEQKTFTNNQSGTNNDVSVILEESESIEIQRDFTKSRAEAHVLTGKSGDNTSNSKGTRRSLTLIAKMKKHFNTSPLPAMAKSRISDQKLDFPMKVRLRRASRLDLL